MYNLHQFCTIITALRKERGWTQSLLAEKIGISPQSVSKWECGIGYPDVTLFPVIARLFDVPIGVLFGEHRTQEDRCPAMKINLNHEHKFVFEPLQHIDIRVGNLCRIEVIDGAAECSTVEIKGDHSFLTFFSAEKENGRLQISVKNPNGSLQWLPYDRGGYREENLIQIHTGTAISDCQIYNYLNLSVTQYDLPPDTTVWVCRQ